MASVKKTIEILFAAKDEMSGVMGSIGSKLKDFDSSVQSIAQPLSNAADSVMKLDAALAALAIAGMAVAINESGKFGDSFAEITTLIAATDAELESFKGDILAYSRESTAGIDDINSAIYTAISAGVSYDDSLKALTQTEQLSVAGKADLESSTRVLISSLNAYGVSVDEAEAFSDALFTTVKVGQTTLPELANSLAQVSTIAAKSGVSFDELMAGIAAVTATGAPTTLAITSIKAAISAILKPSSEASKAAALLGIQFDASALATKGLDGVLKDVYAATGGATDKITELFGSVESLPAVLTLGADTSGKFAEALDAMANKAGATAEAYEKMAENFQLTNQNLANNVKATFIQVGDKLIGSYTDIVGELSDVFKSFGVSIDAGAFDDLFKVLNEMGADITDFFTILAETLPEALEKIDWSGFIKALEDIGVSVGGIFEDFDPGDPDSVAKAIQFVVDSIESLITITKGMIDSFAPFIEAILNSVSAFNEMNVADKEAAGNILGLAKAVTTLGTSLTAVFLLIGDNTESIKTAFEVVAGGIKVGFGSLATGVLAIATVVLEGLDKILDAADVLAFIFPIPGWKDSINEARATIALGMGFIEEKIFDSAELVGKGWAQLTEAFDEPAEAKITIDKKALDVGLEEANYQLIDWSKDPTTIKLLADVTGAESSIEEVQDAWADPDMWADIDLGDLIADPSSMQEIEMPFTLMYKWTDSDGGAHYSDQPPHPDEAIIAGEIIKVPISVEVDKPSLNTELDKVQETLSDREFVIEINSQIADVLQIGADVVASSTAAYGAYAETVSAAYNSSGQLFNTGVDRFASALNESASIIQKHETNELLIDSMEQNMEIQLREMDLRERIQRDNEKHMTRNEELIDQQIDAIYDQVNSLDRHADIMREVLDGTGKIEIDMTGAEPEVELVMWKILKAIQVRANESGSEFLLAAAA